MVLNPIDPVTNANPITAAAVFGITFPRISFIFVRVKTYTNHTTWQGKKAVLTKKNAEYRRAKSAG
jgi:hypothetical protein